GNIFREVFPPRVGDSLVQPFQCDEGHRFNLSNFRSVEQLVEHRADEPHDVASETALYITDRGMGCPWVRRYRGLSPLMIPLYSCESVVKTERASLSGGTLF